MNVLEKIKKMQEDRGWTTYKLSLESGITQSTLSNMFARNSCPSIETLELLCNAFGITLSEFFQENQSQKYLSKEEQALIDNYRSLSPKEKKALTQLAVSLKN